MEHAKAKAKHWNDQLPNPVAGLSAQHGVAGLRDCMGYIHMSLVSGHKRTAMAEATRL